MSQKVNPIVFRLKLRNKWKNTFIEKKVSEFSKHTFNLLELEKIITKFFEKNNLILNNLKLSFFYNNLVINLNYFNYHELNILKKIKFFSFKSKKKKLVNLTKTTLNYKNFFKIYNNFKSKKKKLVNLTKTTLNYKNFFKICNNFKTKHRLKLIKNYKLLLMLKNNFTYKNIKLNFFIEKLFNIINLFLKNKTNFFLILKQINKNLNTKLNNNNIQNIKKILIKTRRYKNNNFFYNGINIFYFIIFNSNNTSVLLTKFITIQLKKLKRHNFFIKFLQLCLNLFIKKNYENFIGIKIKIKGRLNGTPRARNRIINIGIGIPILTIKANLFYSQLVSFTSNGTLGVKSWLYKKKYGN